MLHPDRRYSIGGRLTFAQQGSGLGSAARFELPACAEYFGPSGTAHDRGDAALL